MLASNKPQRRKRLNYLRLQVSKVQAASHLLAVSLASCDIIRFLEQYTACTVKALQCSSKHPAHPYIWDIVIAIFSRYSQDI